MKYIYGVLTGLMVLGCLPMVCFGQDGSDINQAIPIYFGQIITDTIDSQSRQVQIYSIALSKGQAVTVTATGGSNWELCLISPTATTVVGLGNCNGLRTTLSGDGYQKGGLSVGLQVATAGTYYIVVHTFNPGTVFKLQATFTGTPIVSANPAQAGCVSGQVDNITYSLQLVAAGLPDTVSIGGTQLCSSCSVKPPAYPLLVSKLETAMSLNVGVSACYDSSGNIFQLKLNHP